MKIGRGLAVVAFIGAIAGNTGAQAQSCWDQQAVEAAQIREFDIMLMVSALRCQVKGVDFVADYNRFVVGNKAVLVGANDQIRGHFNTAMGGKAALDAYDQMSTAMANRYGNGGVSDDCETLRAIATGATVATPESTRAFLLANAQRVGMDPALSGGRCAMLVAAAPVAPAPVVPVAIAPVEALPVQIAALAPQKLAGKLEESERTGRIPTAQIAMAQ